MRTCLVFLMVLAATAVSGAPAWKWVDAAGQTHYSDRPVPGAEQIDLPGAQGFQPAAPRAVAPVQASAPADRPAPQPAERYRRFEVLSPSQQETLWNIGAVLNVQVAVDPPLQQGHTLDVYINGALQNVNATSSAFSVQGVYRGVHTMQAVILDSAGEEVLRSLAVTFMVQQTSIQNPNNPNAPTRAN